MKKHLIMLLALLASLPHVRPACAQSLAPFRSEYRKQAKGLLTLINDKDVPVRVTLKPQSFTSDENGHLKLLPLDDNVNLVLAQTSLRIPPKETRYVAYEAKPKSPPAWLVIYATFTPEAEGIVVGTSIPHFAYITAGDPKPGEVEMTAEYSNSKKLLHITFTSHSQQLAHVESIETTGGTKKDLGSLSVLPGKSTVIEVKMQGTPPDGVKASGRKFKLQCPVVVE
jgi:hypothetical protein